MSNWPPMHKQFSPRVYVVPTVVDTRRFAPGGQRSYVRGRDHSAETITIVWMGLAFNLNYLDVLAPALRALQSRFHMSLRVVCSDLHGCRESISSSGLGICNVKCRTCRMPRSA